MSLANVDALRSAIATSFTEARPLAHNAFKVELAQCALHRGTLRSFSTAPQSIRIGASAFDTLGVAFERMTVHIGSANRASLIGADIALHHRPGARISMVHTTHGCVGEG